MTGDLPSRSSLESNCGKSLRMEPSRSTSAFSDALAARASNFNSIFWALANGARVIPASTATTTSFMVFLPIHSIRRGQAGGRIFRRSEECEHGERGGGIRHELRRHGAGFVSPVHRGGLPAAAFRVLPRAQPRASAGQSGVRRASIDLLHHVSDEGGGVGVAALGARRIGMHLERAQRVHGPTAIGLLLLPDLLDYVVRSEEHTSELQSLRHLV